MGGGEEGGGSTLKHKCTVRKNGKKTHAHVHTEIKSRLDQMGIPPSGCTDTEHTPTRTRHRGIRRTTTIQMSTPD